MKNFNMIAKFPEVIGAVLSDSSGALVDCVGAFDGEVAGAVHSFSSKALSQAGETLGLGALQKAVITGPGKVCIVSIHDDEVLGVYVDPSKPLGTVEKKLETAIQK